MPGEIQTSFIPKAPMTASARPSAAPASMGVMTIIGLVLVLTSAAVLGGVVAYEFMLKAEIADLNEQITVARTAMPVQNLQEIERLNTSLLQAKTLLDGHVSSSRIFNLLQEVTIPAVRYANFSFVGNKVAVEGTARSYEDIAAQAEIFKNHKQAIISFIFADFSVDDKTKAVNFSLNLTINPEAFRYIAEAPVVSIPPAAVSTSTATTTP